MPEQQARAAELLAGQSLPSLPIDLKHDEIGILDPRGFAELWERSRLVDLNGTHVRVPSAEDHLRILCLHFLKHGGWRPLWLCDIAVALECRPPDFYWDWFFGVDKKRAQWLFCTLQLTHQLLDVRIDDVPNRDRVRVPGWLAAAAERVWSKPAPELPSVAFQFNTCLKTPGEHTKRHGTALGQILSKQRYIRLGALTGSPASFIN